MAVRYSRRLTKPGKSRRGKSHTPFTPGQGGATKGSTKGKPSAKVYVKHITPEDRGVSRSPKYAYGTQFVAARIAEARTAALWKQAQDGKPTIIASAVIAAGVALGLPGFLIYVEERRRFQARAHEVAIREIGRESKVQNLELENPVGATAYILAKTGKEALADLVLEAFGYEPGYAIEHDRTPTEQPVTPFDRAAFTLADLVTHGLLDQATVDRMELKHRKPLRQMSAPRPTEALQIILNEGSGLTTERVLVDIVKVSDPEGRQRAEKAGLGFGPHDFEAICTYDIDSQPDNIAPVRTLEDLGAILVECLPPWANRAP